MSNTQLEGRVFARGFLIILSLLILVFLLCLPSTASDPQPSPHVWFVDNNRLLRVDTTSNGLAAEVPLQSEARALAVDPTDRAVWALRNANLLKFDELGGQLLSLNLRTISTTLDHPWSLALNPYDRSVWVASENSLLHLSSEGSNLLEWRSPDNMQALVLDIDESAWVLTKKQLIHISTLGATVGNAALSAYVIDPGYLAIDDLGGIAWVAAYSDLIRLDVNNLSQTPIVVSLPPPASATTHRIEALAVHPVFGTVWTVSRQTLYLHDRQGASLKTVDLAPYSLGQIRSIAYDPYSHSLWLGGTTGVGRFTSSGDFVTRLSLQKSATALAAAPFKLLPTLSLIDPANNSITNNARPTIRLGLGATCSAIPCLLPDPYLQSLSFEVNLNGQAIGELFQVSGNESSYVPTTPLPEGLSVLDAVAIDLFGHRSETIAGRFTVDTIAPQFTALSPSDGSTVTNSAVTISGIVDDPSANVVLADSSGAGIAMSGATFSFSVVLTSGLNTFSLTARDAAGNATTQPLRVTYAATPLTVSISSPENNSIVSTGTITVNGTVVAPSGTQVTAGGQTVPVAADGTFTLVGITLAEGTNSITVTANAPDGRTATAVLTIIRDSSIPSDPSDVAPTLDRSVVTTMGQAAAFLYSGPNPIQSGLATQIDAKRAAVLRGRVADRNGAPLAGVKITILNHVELGHTFTRGDGMFDIAINGGGVQTINYEKEGYLSVQRQVTTVWQDYAVAPDVVMIPLDTQLNRIELASPLPSVARGSTSTDADGVRRATVIFMPGTTATMTLPNGSTQALTSLGVRATEYTVGPSGRKTMPGELPPASGYTYAVELSVDEAIAAGAKEVRFNQPVMFYLENFLQFPVGQPVPVGYYDRSRGVWVPSDNGRIVKILSISNGVAELDVTGTGQAADAQTLSQLAITIEEQKQLATLYQAGQSLWRVPVTHFTPWDCNWPYGPPADAVPPDQSPPKTDDEEDDPSCQDGSIIECQNQVLGETRPITGTPFSLHYRSDRVPGRKATYINVSLSGPSVPASLKRIELEVTVAGQRFFQVFPAAPNQSYLYEWDGLDAYGRPIQGSAPVLVRIGYVYPGIYQEPANFAQSFAALGNAPMSGVWSRAEITVWQESRSYLRILDARGQGLGGWTLDAHHLYDPIGKVLYLGNGQRRNIVRESVIRTVAGTGVPGYSGDGGNATSAQIRYPHGLATAPDGSVYFVDLHNSRVRRIDPDGTITTVAGTGQAGFSGDGGPAIAAQFGEALDLALGSDGSIYIADTGNNRIRRVAPNGTITTVAGSGPTGYRGLNFSGDGGPATQATLSGPISVAVSAAGELYISDLYNNRIRRVATDGNISTVLTFPLTSSTGGQGAQHLELGADGTLYYSDRSIDHSRVWRLGTDGRVAVVAGKLKGTSGLPGQSGFSGDGGLATQAQVNAPRGIARGPDGALYIADYYNNRIRRIGPDGIIITLAGNGAATYNGDGGVGPQSAIFQPDDVAVASDGSVYISDTYNHRIRRVAAFPAFTGSDMLLPSEDGSMLYHFDPQGRHLRTLNTMTGAVIYTFGYDEQGQLSAIQDGDGNVTTVQRSSGNPTGIVSPDGLVTALAADGNGYLASITNPVGESYAMNYAAGGLLTRLTNARGYFSEMSYDTFGRLVYDKNAANGTWNLARSETPASYEVNLGSALNRNYRYLVEPLTSGDKRRTDTRPDGTRVTTLERSNGTTETTLPDNTFTTVVENPDSRFGSQAPVVSQTTRLPSGLTATTARQRNTILANPQDLLSVVTHTESTTVNGKTSTTVYNAAARQYTVTSAGGRVTQITIDNQARPVLTVVPNIAPVAYSYDTRGRLSVITDGSGADARQTTLNYNGEGFLASMVDATDRTHSFGYDNAGRLRTQTLPDGRVVTWSYDANGNVIGITPPSRPTHAFNYTAVDLEEIYSPPVVAGIADPATRYTYSLDKQLTTIARPDGQTVDLGYDAGGRLNTVTLPSRTVTHGYHATTGQLINVNTSQGQNITYSYDGFLPMTETVSGTITGSVARTYNNDFDVTGLSVNGNQINFGYDSDRLITQAGDLSISRDTQNGLITGTALGAVATAQTYNAFGEISGFTASQSGTSVLDIQYTRDKLGRITQKVETTAGSTDTVAYTYDTAGRLIEVTKNGAIQSTYAYDANGNRFSKTTSGGTVSGSYDNQDRLLSYGNNNYSYAANGELSTKTNSGQTTSYTYDVLGNLTNATLPGGTAIEYVIDGRNRRIGKRVNGALVQGFLYQSQLKPAAELDGDDNVVSRFVYGDSLNVPAYVIRGGQTYRIISDHLGSPRLVVNTSNGNIEQRLDYDEFGNVTADSNPGFQPFGFAGGLYDRDTKLVRFGARDYDAEIGRWTAKDPIEFEGGDTNLYGYTFNDPINWIDPRGLAKDSITASVESAIVRGDSQALRNLLETGALNPTQQAAAQQGLRAIDILNKSTGNVSELAKTFGRSAKELKDAIHACKRNMPKGGPERNPDVIVDKVTGEVYPRLSSGRIGDSIGNIFDHLQ